MNPKTSVAPCGRAQASTHDDPHAAGPSPDWRERLSKYLSTKGLKNSEPRLKIAEVILGQGSHFRVQEVVERVQSKHPGIGAATVYRSVNLLKDAGLLTETLVGEEGETIYEAGDQSHHDHIVCLDCGQIFEFHDEKIEKAQDKVAAELEFEPLRHRHVVYAHCKKLARKKSTRKKS